MNHWTYYHFEDASAEDWRLLTQAHLKKLQADVTAATRALKAAPVVYLEDWPTERQVPVEEATALQDARRELREFKYYVNHTQK